MSCYFIIGDIHGEIRLLDRLLDEIYAFNPDRLIFVGDYIDRGPHSGPVLDRLMDLKQDPVFLMGNHELMMLNAIENTAYGYSPIELWYYNGAEATLQSFGSSSFFSFQSEVKQKYLDFIRNLKMNHIIDAGSDRKILITHAGVSPSIPFHDQLAIQNYRDLHNYILKKHLDPGESFLWVRNEFFYASSEMWENYLVVHGHTPVNKLHRFVNLNENGEWQFFDGDIGIRFDRDNGIPISVDIDSGSTISGRLSALGLIIGNDHMEIVSLTVSRMDMLKRDLMTI